MNKPAWQFEHSVPCKASRSFVWAYWTDVSNWERLEGKAVEWIKLKGPFALGTSGETKMPGQAPQLWTITQFDPEYSATIEMEVAGAVFVNEVRIESFSADRTRITQRLNLSGEKAADLAEGMKVFEKSAPQGLAKLAKAIESAYK